MARTQSNSSCCAACGRLIPRKAGKRKVCSTDCRNAFDSAWGKKIALWRAGKAPMPFAR